MEGGGVFAGRASAGRASVGRASAVATRGGADAGRADAGGLEDEVGTGTVFGGPPHPVNKAVTTKIRAFRRVTVNSCHPFQEAQNGVSLSEGHH